MWLNEIKIVGYKNLKSVSLEFSEKVNCFVGANGSGKTNVVDAIYYSSMCKSLTTTTDRQNVHFDDSFFLIDSIFQREDSSPSVIVCSYKKGGDKVVTSGGKRYERLSDHIGVIPVILVSPYDSALVNDAAQQRRKFIDVLIAQIDRGYLQSLIRYNALITERNKMLKNPDYLNAYELFEVIDMQLAEHATKIYNSRNEFIAKLQPLVADNYDKISGGREQITLTYKTELHEYNFEELLERNIERDRILGHTYSGIHRDDMVIKINDNPIKKFGSWGQQKTLLIALKLAESDMIHQRMGVKPILLLDDIFDKLDMNRVESLLSLVYSSNHGQIFITDSNKTRLSQVLDKIDSNYRLFNVCEGEVEVIKG